VADQRRLLNARRVKQRADEVVRFFDGRQVE